MTTAKVTLSKRPKLTAETAVDYLDWIGANAGNMHAAATAVHLQLAELAIRTLATAAQAKATQHTLVEDGVIAPPTVGS